MSKEATRRRPSAAAPGSALPHTTVGGHAKLGMRLKVSANRLIEVRHRLCKPEQHECDIASVDRSRAEFGRHALPQPPENVGPTLASATMVVPSKHTLT